VIPSIDHLSAEAFISALQAFRADIRQGTVMNRIGKGVDDAEITAMAAYFASRRGTNPR
jgi:cytochrome c553